MRDHCGRVKRDENTRAQTACTFEYTCDTFAEEYTRIEHTHIGGGARGGRGSDTDKMQKKNEDERESERENEER